MNTQPTVRQAMNLIPTNADKDGRHRLGLFQHWLDRWLKADKERRWYEPDLLAYRDLLLTLRSGGHRRSTLSTWPS